MTRDFAFAFSDATPADVKARLSPRCRVLPILNSARCLVSFATRGQTVSEDAQILDA